MKVNKKLFERFGSPKIFFFSVFWLIVLLVIGTIAQKDIGLFQAQEIYFSSWFIWIGDIFPVPGGKMAIGAISIGLFFKITLKTTWNKRSFGIGVTHIGSFLLLFGGILTGSFSYEGSMVIPEGESSGHFQDYHKVEFAIIDTSPKNDDITTTFGEGWLQDGSILKHENFPFQLEILTYCRNCAIFKHPTGSDTSKLIGFAKNFTLKSKERNKDETENRAGTTFKVTGTDKDGFYSQVEFMPVSQTIIANGKTYILELRKKRYNLPFQIELIDFRKENYASTGMAKSYQSEVNLIDKNLKQRTIIQMNEPLRFQGYALYQASFSEETGGDTTVLAVVKNVGRMFPYISSIIICIGLLIHLLLNLTNLFKMPEGKHQGVSHEE